MSKCRDLFPTLATSRLPPSRERFAIVLLVCRARDRARDKLCLRVSLRGRGARSLLSRQTMGRLDLEINNPVQRNREFLAEWRDLIFLRHELLHDAEYHFAVILVACFFVVYPNRHLRIAFVDDHAFKFFTVMDECRPVRNLRSAIVGHQDRSSRARHILVRPR